MRFALAVTLVLAVAAQAAGPDRALTPADIDEAIKAGDITKEYFLMPGRSFMVPGFLVGMVSTPFSRVAAAAENARRTYKPFTAEDVTAEMLAEEPWVSVPSYKLDNTRILNVDAVVMAKTNSKDTDAVVHPLRTQPLDSKWANLMGAETTGQGVVAVFPLKLLAEGFELRIVYDAPFGCGNIRLKECRIAFTDKSLRKVR